MFEAFEKMLLTGMGAVCLTQKKAEELLQELKERFHVTEEEGKAFLEKMQANAQQFQGKLQEMAQEEVKKACERAGMVSAEEFEKLQKKVQHLEKQLKAQGKADA